MRRIGVVTAVLFALLAPAASAQFDPAYEQRNYSKIEERGSARLRPGVPGPAAPARAREPGLPRADARRGPRARPVRQPLRPQAGRLRGRRAPLRLGLGGLRPRASACCSPAAPARRSPGTSGRRSAGPAKRPGVVITNGSVQAPEELYWFAAHDAGQARLRRADLRPAGPGLLGHQRRGRRPRGGRPRAVRAPVLRRDRGRDRLLPLDAVAAVRAAQELHDRDEPRRRSRSAACARGATPPTTRSGRLVDPERLGLAGPLVRRLGRLVRRPERPARGRDRRVGQPPGAGRADRERAVPVGQRAARGPADHQARAGHERRLRPVPPAEHEPSPTRLAKSEASLAYSKAGVDTGQLNIRGGTHYEFSYIPNAFFGATLRGIDLVAWYTGAWMERYVKGDQSATARMLTGRWRDDAASAQVDPTATRNMFSRYYRSRLALRRLRLRGRARGLPGPGDRRRRVLVPRRGAHEGRGPRACCRRGAATTAPGATLPSSRSCRSRRAFTIRLRRPRGDRITRVTVALNGRARAQRARPRAAPGAHRPPRAAAHAGARDGRGPHGEGRRIVTRRAYRTCAPRR